MGEAPKPKKKESTFWLDLLSLVVRLVWIFVFLGAALLFVVGVTTNRGGGMEPAFHDRDVAVYYRLAHTFDTGDVVAYPGPDGAVLLGRVVAVPGDEVEVTADGLKINGYLQNEPHASGELEAYTDGPDYPLRLGEGEYFILRDVRPDAVDSRLLGPLTDQEIKGRVMLSVRQRDF